MSDLEYTKRNSTPRQDFLDGAACLDGIGAEDDRERGIRLLTQAAEAGVPEAADRLYELYRAAFWTEPVRGKALHWAEVRYDRRCIDLGEEHPDTLASLRDLYLICVNLHLRERAVGLAEKAYALRCRVQGERHPDTLQALTSLAVACGVCGDRKPAMARKALEYDEQAYRLCCEVHGETDRRSLVALGNLASYYRDVGEPVTAMDLYIKQYEQAKAFLHPGDTLAMIAEKGLKSVRSMLREQKKTAPDGQG